MADASGSKPPPAKQVERPSAGTPVPRGQSPAQALRTAFFISLVLLLLLLVSVVVRSLFFGPSATDEAVQASEEQASGEQLSDQTEPAGPAMTAPLDGEASSADGVTCGRTGDGTGEIMIEVVDPIDSAEEVVIGIALIGTDGSRDARRITLPQGDPGGVRTVAIPDSENPEVYTSCVITAIQRGQQVLITGR